MATSAPNILAALADPRQYTQLPGRVIFDAHTESDPKTGKLLRNFDRAALERIAANCNARDSKGALCPLTIGHTVRNQYDEQGNLIRPSREEEQPEPVGYARGFRVEDHPSGPVLVADFYVRADRYQDAATYPRTSIELWPNQWVIDPIALLRRTPMRDIPQWTYGRSGRHRFNVLHYSRESHMPMPPPGGGVPPSPTNAMPAPGGAPPAPAPGGGMTDKADQFARHCFSHQYAKELMDHYGGGGAPGMDPAVPVGAEPPPGPPQAFSRDSEIASLQRQLAAMHRENRLNSRRKDLEGLANEGVLLDLEEELAFCGDLQPEQYARHLTRIKRNYARDVTAEPMIPVLRGEGGEVEDPGPARRGPALVQDGALTMAGSRAAIQYQREHPEATYEQAREAILKNGSGRNGRG